MAVQKPIKLISLTFQGNVLFVSIRLPVIWLKPLNIQTALPSIEHSDGTSEQAWYQLNENNQLVFTGVYIFHVDSKFGNKIGKFVIIRSSTKSERDMGFYK